MVSRPYRFLGEPPSDFVVKRESKHPAARIFSGKEEIAKLRKEGPDFKLLMLKDGDEWMLTNKVHGELRPFSFSVSKSAKSAHDKFEEKSIGNEVFVVRNQLFKHNGKIYMLACNPEGHDWNEHVHRAVKHVCRLDNISYDDLSQIDYQHRDFRDKIKRLRGTSVGEASGLGMEEKGHHVRLDSELEGVGIFIAAISYLLYASG